MATTIVGRHDEIDGCCADYRAAPICGSFRPKEVDAPRLGVGAFPIGIDLQKVDFSAIKTGVDGAINDVGRLRTGLSQDLFEAACESIEGYKNVF